MEQFSQKNMIDYLTNFKYLERKYLIKDLSLLNKLEKIEKSTQESKLQKQSNSYAGEILSRIYGFTAEEKIDSSILFNITFDKIICKYLNVSGLENLFNKHYYDFEWDMHLEFDTETGTYNYYRDHMEHQIRNMYMMLKILDEKDYIVEIKKILLKETNSKISHYVKNRLLVLVDEGKYKQHDELFYDCAKKYYESVIDEFVESNYFIEAIRDSKTYEDLALRLIAYFEVKCLHISKDEFLRIFFVSIVRTSDKRIIDRDRVLFEDKTKQDTVKQMLKNWINYFDRANLTRAYYYDYSFAYMIRSSAIISALFHDLSYPLCFSLNMEKRIGEYLPSMNSFVHNLEADIDYVISVLKPSLLFVLVDEKEIRSMLDKNQDKYDHGVLSAISLLLTFYESGRINKLSLDKQTAIELAAVAIYNHNFPYQINSKKATNYYRPVFTQNPISYLLRICDEMQEWERRYFELSKVDPHIFCPICKSPIVEYKYYCDTENTAKNNAEKHKKYYEIPLCRCNSSQDSNYKKCKCFPHRNIYTVTTCKTIDTVVVNQNTLVFHLKYDLEKLLHMTQISCSYSAYRSKELNNLKILLQNQRFHSDNSDIKVDNVYLDYVMTANPIYLKARILLENEVKKFVLTLSKKESVSDNFQENYSEFYFDRQKELDLYGCIMEGINSLSSFNFDTKKYISELKNFFNNKFSELCDKRAFYYKLVIPINREFAEVDRQVQNSLIGCVKELIKRNNISDIREIKLTDHLFNQSMNIIYDLLEDKAERYIRYLVEEKKLKSRDNDIINHFSKRILFYTDVASYISKSLAESFDYSEQYFLESILKSYDRYFPNADKRNTKVIFTLLKDVYSILTNQNDIYNNRIDMGKYIHHFKTEKSVYSAIRQYITPVNWYESSSEAYRKFSFDNLDFYSDLMFFEDD